MIKKKPSSLPGWLYLHGILFSVYDSYLKGESFESWGVDTVGRGDNDIDFHKYLGDGYIIIGEA